MKKILYFLLFLCAFKTSAREIEMKLEELVRESEVIVIADLSDIQEWNEVVSRFKVIQQYSGILTIRKAIWGNYKTGDRIMLFWSNNSSIFCPRNEHHNTKGQNYIWMLNYDDEGKFVTGTSQRVRDVGDASRIDSILKEHPFFMRGMRNVHPENSTVEITLKYRNAFDHVVKIPFIDFKNGTLHIHPTYRLELEWKQLPQDKMIATQDSILVPARSEYTVIIPIREIAAFEKRGYYIFRLLTEEKPEVQQQKALQETKRLRKFPVDENAEKILYEEQLKEFQWESLAEQGFYYVNYK